jgi:hypothetical protein
MVLTKPELIGSLKHEIKVLLHLASKVDRGRLDYRPTPKQRNTLELLQYLSMMGPTLIEQTKTGRFDPPAWTVAANAASGRTFDEAVAEIGRQSDYYAHALGAMSDADFRGEINMFGTPQSRGAFIVNLVLGGHAAYRTQLFCYLKASGREDLDTSNLWAGADR